MSLPTHIIDMLKAKYDKKLSVIPNCSCHRCADTTSILSIDIVPGRVLCLCATCLMTMSLVVSSRTPSRDGTMRGING
jgi:hypothetical protein